MQLKSLEINGFKSFGRKVKLDFNSPISAIVGPNGSGKSNIAESFRFVLGEQSFKSMRGKRGEDLIYSGSQNNIKLNRASVKVVFDNSDKRLPVDFDDVSIERVVNRDGTNEYSINGSSVRLKDISEMLASANIGSSGHHIISQGEADRILNASIKERREMLEDALGLRIFQYKRIESEKKLEKTELNIKEVESLRREIAPHIKFLKKQVEKIEQGKVLREDLLKLYKEYLKTESVYLKFTKEKIEEEIKAPRARLAEIEAELQRTTEKTDDTKNSALLDEIKSIESQLNQVNYSRGEVNRELGQLEGELRSINKILERNNSIADSATLSIDKNELVALESEINLDSNLDNLDAIQLKEIIKSVLSKVRIFIKSKLEKTDEMVVDLRGDVLRIENGKRDLQLKIEELDKKSNDLRNALNVKKQILESDKTDTLQIEKKIVSLMTEKNDLQQIMSRFAIARDVFERDEKSFKEELTEAAVLVGRSVLEYENVDISFDPSNQSRDVQLENKKKLERMKIRVEELGAGSGEDIVKEFQEATERDEFLAKEIIDLEDSATKLKNMVVELDEKIDQKFKEGITKINTEFQKFFELMFGGGSAALQVVRQEPRRKKETDLSFLNSTDSEDGEFQMPEEESEEGIEISVNLPRKKVKGLMMLSGGERSLTSIALIFAMSQVNPPPFIILDETDAALDEANSKKYGDMIENLAKYSQLILITHNRETMSRAGILYGVTMASGVSQLLSIAFDEGIQWAK